MKKEKNKNLGRAGRFLAAALALGLLVAGEGRLLAVPVQAEGSGSLTVQLEAFSPPSVMEGVGITLSRVGDADVSGEPKFYEKYGLAAYPTNSKDTEEAIDKLLAAGALADAAFYEVTDAGGAARFAGLADGIYLGAAREASHYGEIAPFLFHTPYYYGTEDGQTSGPLYEVNVHPKALPLKEPTPEPTASPTPEPTPTPEVTVTPEPTPTPEVTVIPEPTTTPEVTVTPEPTTTPETTPGGEPTPRPGEELTPIPGGTGGNGGTGGSGGTGGTGSTGKGSSVKTGDDTPIAMLLALLCASGLTIEIIRRRRKKA